MGEGWLLFMPKEEGGDAYAAPADKAEVVALVAELDAVDDSVAGFHWADFP